MIVNERGHIEMSDGKSTERVFDCPEYYVGNANYYISFTHMVLDDGRVVVHSTLHEPDYEEDFLYEVAEHHEALHTALTMVSDAEDYLQTVGVTSDQGCNAGLFLSRLEAELSRTLH